MFVSECQSAGSLSAKRRILKKQVFSATREELEFAGAAKYFMPTAHDIMCVARKSAGA
jgi:hypothetical protein